MHLVSIILPNYNHAAFLEKRIKSILMQTYQNFELIILDDFSSDNSRTILDSLKGHPKVSNIIYNNKNSGSTFKQWEKGFSHAIGNFIWIAESDDLAESSFLEKAMSVFNADSSVGVFQCGSNWISEKDTILYADEEGMPGKPVNGKDFILSKMIHGNCIYNASAVVFKKALLKLPLDKSVTSLKYCGDWLFWVKILEGSTLFVLNENLNFFRRHLQSVSTKSDKEGLFFLEGIKVYSYIKRAFGGFNFIDENDKKWAYRFMAKAYPVSIISQYAYTSLSASFVMPAYMAWFNIKKIISKAGRFFK